MAKIPKLYMRDITRVARVLNTVSDSLADHHERSHPDGRPYTAKELRLDLSFVERRLIEILLRIDKGALASLTLAIAEEEQTEANSRKRPGNSDDLLRPRF